MKRLLSIAVLLFLTYRPASAAIWFSVHAPQDDPKARRCLTNRAEVALRAEYETMITTRFYPLKAGDVTRIFGPKLGRRPNDLVLPIYDWGARGLSGLRHLDTGGKTRITLICTPSGTSAMWKSITRLTERVSLLSCSITRKTKRSCRSGRKEPFPKKLAFDMATATALAKWATGVVRGDGYRERLAWDTARFSAIQKWLDKRLPAMTDLGVVEVSPAAPKRIALGTGRECLVTTHVLTRPGMTNDWL